MLKETIRKKITKLNESNPIGILNKMNLGEINNDVLTIKNWSMKCKILLPK